MATINDLSRIMNELRLSLAGWEEAFTALGAALSATQKGAERLPGTPTLAEPSKPSEGFSGPYDG